MRTISLCIGLVTASVSASVAWAQEPVCTKITVLPATLSAPGCYVLAGDGKLRGSTGSAIHVEADDVTLDLGGFRVEASSPSDVGVLAEGRSRVTVKNGRLRGFGRGVVLTGTGHVVEGVEVEDSREIGLAVSGEGAVVRGCRVVRTGGAGGGVYGIRVLGAQARVSGSDIISTAGAALHVEDGEGAVIEGNRVTSATRAIEVMGGTGVVVSANEIAQADAGIVFSEGEGEYRDNLTSGVAAPNAGGLDAGGND